MTTMLAMLKRQRGAAPLQPSDESADDSTSTSLRDPTYNICQEAFCDDGRKAAVSFQPLRR